MTERLFDFASLLGDDFSTRWMITMLHFLWQGAIVGAIVAMLAGMLHGSVSSCCD